MNPENISNATSVEGRVAPRKALRRSARLTVKGKPSVSAKTVDVSTSGASVIVPESIEKGSLCLLVFDLPINGKLRKVTAVAKAVYSVCVGLEGFRIGLQYVEIDMASTSALNEFVS